MSETHTSTDARYDPEHYEICIKGHLADRWVDWLEGLTITLEDSGLTILPVWLSIRLRFMDC